MDGLIVNEPYASMIIERKKKWELRSRKPPEDKIKNKIGLLSQGKMLGTIEITDSKGPLTVSDLKKTISFHQSEVKELPKGVIAGVCSRRRKKAKGHHER